MDYQSYFQQNSTLKNCFQCGNSLKAKRFVFLTPGGERPADGTDKAEAYKKQGLEALDKDRPDPKEVENWETVILALDPAKLPKAEGDEVKVLQKMHATVKGARDIQPDGIVQQDGSVIDPKTGALDTTIVFPGGEGVRADYATLYVNRLHDFIRARKTEGAGNALAALKASVGTQGALGNLKKGVEAGTKVKGSEGRKVETGPGKRAEKDNAKEQVEVKNSEEDEGNWRRQEAADQSRFLSDYLAAHPKDENKDVIQGLIDAVKPQADSIKTTGDRSYGLELDLAKEQDPTVREDIRNNLRDAIKTLMENNDNMRVVIRFLKKYPDAKQIDKAHATKDMQEGSIVAQEDGRGTLEKRQARYEKRVLSLNLQKQTESLLGSNPSFNTRHLNEYKALQTAYNENLMAKKASYDVERAMESLYKEKDYAAKQALAVKAEVAATALENKNTALKNALKAADAVAEVKIY